MKIPITMVQAVLLVVVAAGAAGSAQRPAKMPKQAPVTSARIKDSACECCQKCRAAMKAVQPRPKGETKPEKDGCQQCCERCGMEKKPTQEVFPPEVVPR